MRLYRLVGWVRFRQGGDDSGVPVFSVGANSLFVPETNDDLAIVHFHEFYNEQHFAIDYRLPEGFQGKIYAEGDWAPIPFCVSGRPAVVEAGTSSSEFLALFEGQPVSRSVQHVADILHRQTARKPVVSKTEKEMNVDAANRNQAGSVVSRSEYWAEATPESDDGVEKLHIDGREYIMPLEAHRRIEWQQISGGSISHDDAVLVWCGELVLYTDEGGANGPWTSSFDEAATWAIEAAHKRPIADICLLQILSYRCPVTHVEQLMSEQNAAYDVLSKFWIAAIQPYSTDSFWESSSGKPLPTHPPVSRLIEKMQHLKEYGPEESATELLSRAKNVYYGGVSEGAGRDWSASNEDETPPF